MEKVIQRNKITFKDVLFFFLFVVFIALIGSFELFYPYTFGHAFNEDEVIRSVGAFSAPTNYKLTAVKKGKKGENRLVLYVNQENNQKIFLTILREHLTDRLDSIRILDNTKVERTFDMSEFEMNNVSSFTFTYLLPLPFRRVDLTGRGDEAIIKGINVKANEKFETAASDIFYVQGEFTKIGLYKEPNGWWEYPTPVFDFKTLHEGALAFIKSKKSGKVLVSVSVNSLGQFNEKEFRDFVESVEPA
jgi:hypothetical protein